MKNLFGFIFAVMLCLAATSVKAQGQNDQNVYGENTAARPVSPYGSSESFTVTKFKESKVKRKLRRGESRSRLSVPQPKGKPLKHKKKRKVLFFGRGY